MGVLVAVSISIFTSQLKKARLATNQANARAAYAAAVADCLDATASGISKTYKYDVAKATIVSGGGTATIGSAPQQWTLSNRASLGNQTYTVWYVAFDANDNVKYGHN